MTTPEDHSFFEELNKDLASQLNDSIKDAFKNVEVKFGRENAQLIGDQVAKAVKGAGGDSSKGGGEGDGDGGSGGGGTKKKGGFMAAVGAFGKTVGKLGGVIAGISQPIQKAANDIQSFGTTMGRTAAMTGRHNLVGARMVKDAAGNVKDIDFSMPEIETAFGEWGTSFADTGKILDAALRDNVDATDHNMQSFLARSTGLGNDMRVSNAFLATNTNVLGLSTAKTGKMGTAILNTATASNRVADGIFAAVAAFEQTSKEQSLIFGKSMAAEMQKVVAAMESAIPGTDIHQLLKDMMGGSSDAILNARRLASRVGVDASLQETDPTRFMSELIDGISRYSAQAGDSPLQRAINLEALGDIAGGVDMASLQAATRFTEEARNRGVSTMDLMTAKKLSPEEQKKKDAEGKRLITGVDATAAANMKDFAMSLAGSQHAFEALDQISQTLRESFFDVNGELTKLAKTLGAAAGAQAAFNMGKTALGIGSVAMMAGSAFMGGKMLHSGAKRMFGGRGGGGGGSAGGGGGAGGRGPQGSSRAFRAGQRVGGAYRWAAGDTWGRSGNVARSAQGIGLKTALNPHTGLPHNVAQPLSSVSKGTRAGGAFRSALGKGSTRIPIVGGIIEGGMEYAETGDKSRAVTKAVGTAGGAWGGAATGAGLGALTGPLAPVMVPLLGILGGIGGAIFGSKASEVVHDKFDPEFVAEQAKKKEAEAQAIAQERMFTGSAEELKARAEEDALAAAQLDENKEQTEYLRVIAESFGSENPAYDGTGSASIPKQIHDERFKDVYSTHENDGWENVYYLQSYNAAANRIRKSEATQGGNT